MNNPKAVRIVAAVGLTIVTATVGFAIRWSIEEAPASNVPSAQKAENPSLSTPPDRLVESSDKPVDMLRPAEEPEASPKETLEAFGVFEGPEQAEALTRLWGELGPRDRLVKTDDPDMHGISIQDTSGNRWLLWSPGGPALTGGEARSISPQGSDMRVMMPSFRSDAFTFETSEPSADGLGYYTITFQVDTRPRWWKTRQLAGLLVPGYNVGNPPTTSTASYETSADHLQSLADTGVDISSIPAEYLPEYHPDALSEWGVFPFTGDN